MSDEIIVAIDKENYYPGRPIEFSASNDASDIASGYISIEDAEKLIKELNNLIDEVKGIT